MSALGKFRDEEPLGAPVEGGMLISNDQLKRFHPDIAKARGVIRRVLMDAREPKVVRGPTPRPTDVRIAGPADELAVFELIKMDLAEIAGTVAPVDPYEVQEIIMRGTRRRGGIVAVIDGPNGKPVAVQILITDKWWWSKQRHLSKIVDYVHPDHRQSTHAAHLIQFEKWAADAFTSEFGYQIYLLSAVLGTKKVREKLRLYGKHMTQAGGFFLYPWPYPWD